MKALEFIAVLCGVVALGFIASAAWDIWRAQRTRRREDQEQRRLLAQGLSISTMRRKEEA